MMENYLKSYALKFIERIEKVRQHNTDIEIVIKEILLREDIASINNPCAYIEFLRGCFEPLKFSVKIIKKDKVGNDFATKRFLVLLDILKRQTPSIPSFLAHDIVVFNDKMTHMCKFIEHGTVLENVSLHFSKCSSTPKKAGFYLL